MPTNLKSLLSRSRSRNELKLREKGEENGSSELSNENENTGGQCRCEVTNSTNCNNSEPPDLSSLAGVGSTTTTPSVTGNGNGNGTGAGIRRDASCKSFFSCSALQLHSVGVGVGGENTGAQSCCWQNISGSGSSSSDTTTSGSVGAGTTLPTTGVECSSFSNCCCCSGCCSLTNEIKDSCQSLSMRKCKTVLALSSFSGSPTGQNNNTYNYSSSSSNNITNSNSLSSSSSVSAMATSLVGLSESPVSQRIETHSTSSSAGGVGIGIGDDSVSVTGTGNGNGRVKLMKDKILSTSSSTLNSLIHSSSKTTSKLFGGWKFSTNASNSNSNNINSSSSYNTSPVSTSHHTNHQHHHHHHPHQHQHHHHFHQHNQQQQQQNHHHHHHHCNYSSSNTNTNTNTNGMTLGTPSPVTTNSGNYPYISSHGMMISGSKSKSQLSIAETPMTPTNRFRLRRHVSVTNSSSCLANNSVQCDNMYSRSSSVTSFNWKEDQIDSVGDVFCRLCLSNYKFDETAAVGACSCRYCRDCLVAYVIFEIQEGAYEIACPDASCEKEGVLSLEEIEGLVPNSLMDKHKKFRLYREVEKDVTKMWCQTPGCETVCTITDVREKVRPGVSTIRILCSTCEKTYCAECKLSWHPETTCESHRRALVKQGKLNVDDEELYSIESIKKCPFCHIPISKDSGCAQMMCKRCKHVFCWYCLASLDNDLLLRHYDKGPCKNKLGHSRASVVWHRAQVIGIFAGFGVLVLLASPILILAAPCLLCCRCRYCATKLDGEDPVPL